MVFSFSCTEKTTTAKVTEYSTRMQTRSVLAASMCDRVDPLLRRANAAKTSARVLRVVENFDFPFAKCWCSATTLAYFQPPCRAGPQFSM